MDELPPHILIADDQLENLLVLGAFLEDEYTVHSLTDGQQVLDYLTAGNPAELILLDVVMPGLDGYETCRHIKATPETRDIPVLFISSLDSSVDEERGLALGAEDFIRKPFSPPVVLARIRNHLSLARVRRVLRDRNSDLEYAVAERTREALLQAEQLVRSKQELIAAQSVTISAFCALAEARDNETGNHIRRTQNYVRILAEHLSCHPRFAAVLHADSIELLYRSAPLHDVGKVAIPDAILLKPDKLTAEEWRIMKTHCWHGFNAIASAGKDMSGSDDFLRYARDISHYHHERYDGKGYPHGLAGEAIPLAARLMAVADVYDALISRRVYKPAYPHEQAIEMMTAERGYHFDPDILDALLLQEDFFHRVACQYADD